MKYFIEPVNNNNFFPFVTHFKSSSFTTVQLVVDEGCNDKFRLERVKMHHNYMLYTFR